MANGTGLMGEAGPEAVIPLSRTSSGELGVKAINDNSVNSNRSSQAIHITVEVSGARGSAEIEEAVEIGVTRGLAAYDEALPSKVQRVQSNPRFGYAR